MRKSIEFDRRGRVERTSAIQYPTFASRKELHSHPGPFPEGEGNHYLRGFSTTTASGGRVTSIENGRPWAMWSVAMMPGPLPRLLPP
jgi:hypothetical protein